MLPIRHAFEDVRKRRIADQQLAAVGAGMSRPCRPNLHSAPIAVVRRVSQAGQDAVDVHVALRAEHLRTPSLVPRCWSQGVPPLRQIKVGLRGGRSRSGRAGLLDLWGWLIQIQPAPPHLLPHKPSSASQPENHRRSVPPLASSSCRLVHRRDRRGPDLRSRTRRPRNTPSRKPLSAVAGAVPAGSHAS